MSSSLPIVSIFYLLGAAHGAFLAVALVTHKSGSRRANVYLSCYTLLFVLALVDYFFDASGVIDSFIFIKVLLWPKEFFYGVLVYFYTRELTQPEEYPLKGAQWWHFAPAVLHVLFTWPLLLMPEATQAAVLSGDGINSRVDALWSLLLRDIEMVLSVGHVTIYLLLSLHLLRIHRSRLLSSFSSIEKISLDWLRYLLVGTLIVYMCWLGDELIDLGGALSDIVDTILGLSIVILIYCMSILGLKQPKVFSVAMSSHSEKLPDSSIEANYLPQIDTVKMLEKEEKQKYQYSALTPAMCEQLMTELENHMNHQRPYRDSNLSLPKLAADLGVSNNYLSQVINQQAKQNFFDFINAYRIADVQALIRANPSATVLDLAMEAGFNSKSAFYNAFRKHTGQTPSQFKKSL